MDRDDARTFAAGLRNYPEPDWYATAKSDLCVRDIFLIAASWAVLVTFFLYPALYLGALGATALVLSATGRGSTDA